MLWILVLVGALAASYLTAARAERRAVAHNVEIAQARWAARAAFARATSELDEALASAAGPSGGFRGAGDTLLAPVRLETNGVTATAALVDARSRLHLNRATRDELSDLMRALGASPASARRLAANVVDWRDPDDRSATGRSEADAYAARLLPERPRNAPFTTVREIAGVLGMDTATAAGVRRYVTVSGDGRINLNAAPAPVLSTLPGLGPDAAGALVAARTDGPFSGSHDVLDALPSEAARRVRSRRDAFDERTAYGPRHVELVAESAPSVAGRGARVRAEIELEGGRTWRIVRTVER